MIYLKDILLTCAALFLLNAALGAKSRITQASAQLESDFSGETRKFAAAASPERQIGSLMSKLRHLQQDKRNNSREDSGANAIRKSLAPAVPEEDGEHRENNSYRYYANKTSHLEQQQLGAGDRRPSASKPVEVGFLRSSFPAGNGSRSSNATLVYMLSGLHWATPSESTQVNEIDTGEQQQPPPFTMMPPYNQQQQQQLLLQQQLNGPQNNIRQILSNYQRLAAPQVPYLAPNAGQQLAPLANQRPASNNNMNGEQPLLRPAAGHQAHNVPNQQQQPFSPLQLITGPLQAFQNAFNPQNLNSNNNQPHNAPPATTSQAPALTPTAAGEPQTKPPAISSPTQQQHPQLPGFLQQLNPFGPQLNQQQQSQLQQPQQSQLPNLQALYQQLPLYQALLAARQRQEALQAAHRARQQQQQPLSPFSGGLINAGAPGQTPHAQIQQPGYPQQAYGQVNQPANQVNSPQNQPQSPQTQQPPAPVQFDDDNNNVNTNNNNGQQDNNDNNSNNNNSNDNSGQQEQANQNDQPESGNNGPEQADQNNNNHEQGGGGETPQEEDPDLKQFQNLANGGDSFTDLFPPGILSNNDITDIKTQQAEQARKQEEEERQRQLRNQQAHTHSQQQPQQHFHQQQPQPINQLANNQQQQPGNNQQPASGQDDTDAGNANDNSNNDEPQNENGQNEEEGGGGENEGNNGASPGDGDGEEEQEGGEPEAAALTSKSSSSPEHGGTKPKLTSSPGVVYSREAGA